MKGTGWSMLIKLAENDCQTSLLNEIIELQALVQMNITFLFLRHFYWLWCHMKGQEMNLSNM